MSKDKFINESGFQGQETGAEWELGVEWEECREMGKLPGKSAMRISNGRNG